jgi:hypothetical protein
MAEYLILHRKNPTFRLNEDHKYEDGYLVATEHYDKVAIVDAKNLGEAFELTNHTDHDWTRNDRVMLFNKKLTVNGVRSTSVGDLALNLDTMELRICGPVGWEKALWVS